MKQEEGTIDNWMDYLIKRWPLMVAVGLLVLGVVKTQFVQNAQATEMVKMRETVDGFSEIKAEWPYLKNKVEEMNKKVDKVDDKLDILISRP